jgi:hypothetical protein
MNLLDLYSVYSLSLYNKKGEKSRSKIRPLLIINIKRYNTMENYHIIIASYLPATNTNPSRIKLFIIKANRLLTMLLTI